MTTLWFSQPIDEVLRSANEIGGNYYREHETLMADHAQRIARGMPVAAVESGDLAVVRAAIAPEVTREKLALVEVYRLTEGVPSLLVAAESPSLPSLPRGQPRGMADRLAARIASGGDEKQAVDPLDGGGELVRAGGIIRESSDRAVGVVLDRLILRRSREIRAENHGRVRKLSAARRAAAALQGVYLSLFLMMSG